MLKKRIIAVVTGLALLAIVGGSSGIMGDWLGMSVTPPAHACNDPSVGGGGC